MQWTKSHEWPEELAGAWVWRWNKYDGDWRPKLIWLPRGFDRSMQKCWGTWYASRDYAEPSLPITPKRFVNHLGGNFLIAHFAGSSILRHPLAIATFRDAKISLPSNITLLTFATSNVLANALLIRQLDAAGIGYRNLAAGVTTRWYNRRALAALVEALPSVDTKYTLILDGIDVLLCGPLDPLVERFAAYQKRVVFMATKTGMPRGYPFNLAVEGRSAYGYLGLGSLVGYTWDVRDFVERAVAANHDGHARNLDSLYREVWYAQPDTIGLDHRCDIFQVFVGHLDYAGEVVRVCN